MGHLVASSSRLSEETPARLLTVRQVQEMLHVDRSTIYRMAADGRLPAVRVGRQLRFSPNDIRALVSPDGQTAEPAPLDPVAATAAIEVASQLLDVMMVVTDMSGRPITAVVNACPSVASVAADEVTLAECLAEWRELATDTDLAPKFRLGSLGFECARAFVRDGSNLIGMVLIGGVAPATESRTAAAADGLTHLSEDQRRRALEALPLVARAISSAQTTDPQPDDPLAFHLSPAAVGA